jgi:hypothetical protein
MHHAWIDSSWMPLTMLVSRVEPGFSPGSNSRLTSNPSSPGGSSLVHPSFAQLRRDRGMHVVESGA